VTTIRFQVLYVFLILARDRRRIRHFRVAALPTAEWAVQQLGEAFPWETAQRYLLRDRHRIFGADFVKQGKTMSIKQVLSTPRSPWQRAHVERSSRSQSWMGFIARPFFWEGGPGVQHDSRA
jgi:hypothetical protein